MKVLALPGSGSSSAVRGPSSSILRRAAPGGAGATRGEPGGRLEGRGHTGAGGLGAAPGRLQRRGCMTGRAAASPPAGPGAGPPPSACPAGCGLRSSSSPCLRGPEPGGRRRGGPPPLPVLPPSLGAGRLRGCACPLRAPPSARGRGCCRRRMLPRAAAASRALRTAGSLTPTSSPGSSSSRGQ